MTEPTSITCQLVGAHFRPPAKALLAVLPAGHPLFLRPEPDNPYDANAVQVLLATSTLPSDEAFLDNLASELAGQGFSLDDINVQGEWHLGFLPRAAKGNPQLEQWNIQVQQAIHETCKTFEDNNSAAIENYSVVPCSLTFDAAGKPAVLIPWPPAPQASG